MYDLKKRSEGRGLVSKFIIFMAAVSICCFKGNVSFAESINGVNEKQDEAEYFVPLINSHPQEQTILNEILEDMINDAIPEDNQAENQQDEEESVLIRSEDVENQPVAFDRKKRDKEQYKKHISKVKESLSIDMNVAKRSGLSKEEFVKVIKNMDYDYKWLFKRNAEVIYNLCKKYQINEFFFIGIIAQESCWGSSRPARATNNYTSQMNTSGRLIHYSDEKTCLEVTAKNLGKNYLTPKGKYYHGKTMKDVNRVYCEPKILPNGDADAYHWSKEIVKCMKMIVD